jgi:cytochrome P450
VERCGKIVAILTLTTYADVSAALRDPRLTDDTVHVAVRDAALRELSPSRLAAWLPQMEVRANELAWSIPRGREVDLVAAFARPWSCELACAATRVSHTDSSRLLDLAREVFLAAAAGDPSPANASTVELSRSFHDSIAAVQTFIALSQTLPCLLAGAWLALIRHPEQLALLRSDPALMPNAIEELLRYAGPSRAVFRKSASGEQVALMIGAANRDPARFPDPDRLDLRRDASGHLAFGAGTHACAGAALVRLAAATATAALLANLRTIDLVREPAWIDGIAIRGPSTLPADVY